MKMEKIGTVHSSRKQMIDDNWESESVYIELENQYPADSLQGLEDFSHVEIVFYMDQVDLSKIELVARHPRGNTSWPKVGIFAQRAKNRPNQIGLTLCSIMKIEGKKLYLKGLDAIDGTPILDIKPVMQEFLPREKVRQPAWSQELMKDYWEKK